MQIGGRTFVVTGGGDGIGRQVVLTLLGRGARVAAVDLREEALKETARLAGPAADRLSRHTLDVRDEAAVAALPQAVVDAHGQVDGLLNVAGVIQPFVRVADLDPAVIDRVMGVNFFGVVATCRAFLPLLLARPQAAIVNVSSMGALVPVPGQAVYSASKAAVTLFTEALYAETCKTGVRVTDVIEGSTDTSIAANSGVDAPAGVDVTASRARTTSAEDAARQIVDGMARGRFRVVVGKDARAFDVLSRLSPRRATDLVARKMANLLGGG